jgi:cytochrome c-type biogenesis protein CcmF
MPWLTGTAFIHSLMIQEKRGMLKIWNISLVLATGTLAIMGTFLVRSGILSSIHAFGGQTLGVPFVCLIGALIAGSIYLVVSRRAMLRSEHRLDSLLSRESIFLANNLVLVGLCFVIFWGTYFPLISEALTGQEASVGPPWFDRYTVPLALVLVLLSGVGPVIAWRRATLTNARRNFLVPLTAALSTLIVLLLTGVREKPLAFAMFCCAAFALASVGQEFWRGVRVRRAMANEAPPLALFAHRYGGAVHRRGGFLVLPAPGSTEPLARAVDQSRAVSNSLPATDRGGCQRSSQYRVDAQSRCCSAGIEGRALCRDAAPQSGLLRLR